MPPVGEALRNVGRLPNIPSFWFGFLLLMFFSVELLQALAEVTVAGEETSSEVHLFAAYVVWLLTLVVTLLPVVIPRPPLVGRVALLMPPVVVRERAALRNLGRLPNISIWFGFLLLVFFSCKLLQSLAEVTVSGEVASSEVRLLAAYVVWLLTLVVTLLPVVIPRPPVVGRVGLLMPPVVVRERAALRNLGRLPNISIWFGFLLLVFFSCKLLQSLAEVTVSGEVASSEVRLLAAYVVWLLTLVVTLLPVVIPRPPVVGRVALPTLPVVVRERPALRNVGRTPNIPSFWFGLLLLMFFSVELLQALAEVTVAGEETSSEVHLFAAYVVWLLTLVVTLLPVVIPRPPLVGRVALLMPPVVVRERAALSNLGRLPNISVWFGFLLLVFISGELLQSLAEVTVAGEETSSEVRILAAYVVWLLTLVIALLPVVIPRPPLVGRVALPMPPVVVRAGAALCNVERVP
ncbi:hypothetical protein OPV22_008048 [Ensete ventricosum]|uniref:Uncharacterized protein n=1 Tax=Ensete ventricosum TaxID=4639 RepID=A0AAV8RBU5_ENSVE|nr:hypothetical protein OPV22_008048 [Ensete ventricosum]